MWDKIQICPTNKEVVVAQLLFYDMQPLGVTHGN